MDVGRRIREVREDLGMPAAVLARRIGVAPNTVWRYESGEREPSMTMLEKIAHELRTEPAELMRDPALGAGKGEAPQETGRDDEGQILWHLASLDEITPGLIGEAFYAGEIRRASFEVQDDGSVIVRGWSA